MLLDFLPQPPPLLLLLLLLLMQLLAGGGRLVSCQVPVASRSSGGGGGGGGSRFGDGAESMQRAMAGLGSTRDQVTFLLDSLLKGYDKSLRPVVKDHEATVITSYINIRSMGPISELHMDYSLDLYFRQLWQDPRLRYDMFNIANNMSRGLILSMRMLDNIWKPDTYFINGKGSYMHTLTTPNKLIRLYPNGEILYSMRLTVKASCPMHLRYFPMDEQVCPLIFGSYGYPSADILYRWKQVTSGIERAPVVISTNVTLSQFNLTTSPEVRRYFLVTRRGNFSVLSVYFHLVRHTGFFIIQVYLPCGLLVVLSWVSFWINREATADRVSLGITTVLTLTTLCHDSRQDLPRVGYATGLDYYIVTCYSFLIASIVEFACVHHFTKCGYGEPTFCDDSDDSEDDGDGDHHESATAHEPEAGHPTEGFGNSNNNVSNDGSGAGGGVSSGGARRNNHHHHHHHNHLYHQHASSALIQKPFRLSMAASRQQEVVGSQSAKRTQLSLLARLTHFLGQLLSCIKGPDKKRPHQRSARINSVSKIDQVSKVIFPTAFLAMNVLYWLTYLKRIRFTGGDQSTDHDHMHKSGT